MFTISNQKNASELLQKTHPIQVEKKLIKSRTLTYLPHIDGLRAIAVLSVFLYHLGLSPFQGGYVGVDIFFVISGYLISKIIYSEIENKEFSVSNFYARRAKRILPAFIFTIAASSIFAYSMLYGQELAEFARSAIAGTASLANVYFYWTSNYFSKSANEIPLLHLWSLGIEEQFYIIFPLLALGIVKVPRWIFSSVLILLIAISAAASEWMLRTSPDAAFYLLPFRAFELLIGCLIALSNDNLIKNKHARALITAAGLSAIAFSVARYQTNSLFPGFMALLPCAGTAMVIMASTKYNPIAKTLLEGRAIGYIGKISYSLYLIHWPVIVFGKRIFPNASPLEFNATAIIITFVLASLSFQLIEKRFHRPKKPITNSKVLWGSAIAAACVISISSVTVLKNGFTEHPNVRIAKVMEYLQYKAAPFYLSGECFLEPTHDFSLLNFPKCLPATEFKKAVLWGDSHAAEYYFGFKAQFEQRGYSLGMLSASACPPIKNITVNANPKCTAFNEIAYSKIMEYAPDLIVLSANWVANDETMDAFEKTLQKLSATPVKIVILGEAPLYKRNVPHLIVEKIKNQDKNFFSSEDLEKPFLDNSYKAMTERFDNRKDLKFINVMNLLCPGGACPLLADDGSPAQFDIAHFTAGGSMTFGKIIAPAIFEDTNQRY